MWPSSSACMQARINSKSPDVLKSGHDATELDSDGDIVQNADTLPRNNDLTDLHDKFPTKSTQITYFRGTNPNHTSPREVPILPTLHRFQPTRFSSSATRTLENVYQDLRSPSRTLHRILTVNTKYFAFRSIKRNQLNFPHLKHDIDRTTSSDEPRLVSLPADWEIMVMDRALLFQEAQKWPKPPRRHRSAPSKDRPAGQMRKAKKYEKREMVDLVEESHDLAEAIDEWDSNETKAKEFWGDYKVDDEDFEHVDTDSDCSDGSIWDELGRIEDLTLETAKSDCFMCYFSGDGSYARCEKHVTDRGAETVGMDE